MADMPVIYAKNVARVYQTHSGEVHALSDINLKIRRGELVVLKGRSGSGKTTLLNCIGGLDTPTSGKIFILGKNLAEKSDNERTAWRRHKIGFVFQSLGLLPMFSTYENLDIGLRLAKIPRRERRERILDGLGHMGLSQWVEHRPFELSGGQQQRIAIVRAMISEPPLILADEPTSELDSETTYQVLDLMRDTVNRKGTTMLISTHDPIVDEYADRIIHLQDGQIARG